MAYGDTEYKKMGIKKEDLHLPILNKLFNPVGIILVKSDYTEDTEEKIDFWGIKNGTKKEKYPFDFKTAVSPQEKFCLTYKINNTNKNVFETSNNEIMYIFLLEHIQCYAFIKKEVIHKWFKDKKPPLYPGKTDNSNYYHFPTSEIFKLTKHIKSYKKYL